MLCIMLCNHLHCTLQPLPAVCALRATFFLQEYASVEEYVELESVGHCPQDEAPHLVNPLVLSFVQRHGKHCRPL